MPQKGLKKGDGVWGSGKTTFLKSFFLLPQEPLKHYFFGKTLWVSMSSPR